MALRTGSVLLVVAAVGGASFLAGLQVDGLTGPAPLPALSTATLDTPPPFVPALAFEVPDPAGDARDLRVDRLGYGPGCHIACQPLPAAAAAAGPAGPYPGPFDILAVGLVEERSDALVLAIRLAELPEGFLAVRTTPGTHYVAEYEACWRPAAGNATRCALLDVVPTHDGVALQSSFHIRGAGACNEWAWCAWSIPATLTYGTPGEVRFTVPKAYAAYDGAPPVLDGLTARTGWWGTNKVLPMWHLAWTAHQDGDHLHDHLGLIEASSTADASAPSQGPVALTPGTGGAARAAGEPLASPGPGAVAGAGSIRDYPELDLLAFDLSQEGADLVVRHQFAGFERVPDWDFQVATILGVRGGLTYEVGAMRTQGEAYGYAGRCVSFGCHDGFLVKLPLDVQAGSPGVLEVRVPRSTWPDLLDGAETDFLLAYTMYGEANQDVGAAGAPLYGNVHSGSLVDVAFGAHPYVFGSDHAGVFDDGHGHRH